MNNGREIKLLQFADDTNGVLSDTTSAKMFLKLVKEFGKVSGLLLNKNKTDAAWLGSQKDNNDAPLGISWPKSPLKIFGVYMSYDENENSKLNFENKLKICKTIFDSWKSRNLSILGKVLILKTFIISQFFIHCKRYTNP